VEKLSHAQHITDVFYQDFDDIPTKYLFLRPSYEPDVDKLQMKLENKFGGSWAGYMRRKKVVRFGADLLSEDEYPWARIQASHAKFPVWHRKHANIFNFEERYDTL